MQKENGFNSGVEYYVIAKIGNATCTSAGTARESNYE